MIHRLVFLSLLMLGVSCQQAGVATIESQVSVPPRSPSEIRIPFSTVENVPFPSTEKQYDSESPGIIVVSDAADAKKVRGYISEKAYTRVANLDFATQFAVIAFQGLKTSNGYDISVQEISRSGNDIFIYARLQEPAPDQSRGDMVTSPYSLVIAEKNGIEQQDNRYHLIGNGTEIATFSLGVP